MKQRTEWMKIESSITDWLNPTSTINHPSRRCLFECGNVYYHTDCDLTWVNFGNNLTWDYRLNNEGRILGD